MPYAIMRFAKYKGPEIGPIEAHNERTKERYASNPDVDLSRTHLNYHLVTPAGKYRAEAEKQIAATNCRTRSDSVRLVEMLVTASPEFFEGKSREETERFFKMALDFIKEKQRPDTIVSAVVHMDEKTPHMHLVFVPLTEDGRLCAKEILGNKKKLTLWQDGFWEKMVGRYPELERGESASKTGRRHIPPRVYKEMSDLTKQSRRLDSLLDGMTPFNAKQRAAEIRTVLHDFLPGVEKMSTQMKKYGGAFRELKAENKALTEALHDATDESIIKKMKELQLKADYEDLLRVLEKIPAEVLSEYVRPGPRETEREGR